MVVESSFLGPSPILLPTSIHQVMISIITAAFGAAVCTVSICDKLPLDGIKNKMNVGKEELGNPSFQNWECYLFLHPVQKAQANQNFLITLLNKMNFFFLSSQNVFSSPVTFSPVMNPDLIALLVSCMSTRPYQEPGFLGEVQRKRCCKP